MTQPVEPVDDDDRGPYIYVNARGANALLPYLKSGVERPDVYPPNLVTPPAVLLAYSNTGQGTAVAVAAMCLDNQMTFVTIQVPKPGPGSNARFFTTLQAKRAEYAGTDTVFIIRNCERNYARGDRSADPAFFEELDAAMRRVYDGSERIGNHVAVACLAMVPSGLPGSAAAVLPIQCYFAPPGTEERAKLFHRFFEELRHHFIDRDLLPTLKWELDDEVYGQLADHSQSNSLGEIREFVGKVFHTLMPWVHVPGAELPVVDHDFVFAHLTSAGYLNESQPDTVEDSFRAYAGEPQSHHLAPSAKRVRVASAE